MSTPDLLHFLPTLACLALAGRLLLACMPADRHDRRQLPVTWITSLYLGLAGLTLEIDLAHWMGLEPRPWQLALPWLVLGSFRLLTMPGAMAPRHAPPEPAPTGLARCAASGLTIWLLLIVTSTPLPESVWKHGYPQVPQAMHAVSIAVFVCTDSEWHDGAPYSGLEWRTSCWPHH